MNTSASDLSTLASERQFKEATLDKNTAIRTGAVLTLTSCGGSGSTGVGTFAPRRPCEEIVGEDLLQPFVEAGDVEGGYFAMPYDFGCAVLCKFGGPAPW